MIRKFRSRAVATAALVSMVVGPTTAWANDAPTACPDGEVASSGFEDTEGTVHEQNIDCILDYGITQGLNPRTYGPALNVSRAQMATFLARTIDLAAALPAATDQGFEDISGTVHEDRINQLAAAGVANGTSSTAFSPNLSISRGQMAVFLVRAWEASTDQVLQRQGTRRFNDTEGTAFADAIDVAFEMGWTKGTTSGQYNPGAPVSRGAMASFIARFLEDLSARGSIGKGTAPSLTAFTVGDNDGSGTVSNGDTLFLKYDQDVIANSSITLQDEDGTKTIIDDTVNAGVPEGRTAATISGSGTNTLVFTLTENIDVFGPGGAFGADGILNGVITVIASEGISGVDGNTWVPTQDADGDKSATLTPPPSGGGGGGGGGGGTPSTAPSTVTVAFTPDQISASEATSAEVGGNSNGTSPVIVTIVIEDFEGDKITATAEADGAGDYSSAIDFSATPNAAISDGTITATATATNTVGSATPVTATALLDREAPASPTATVVDDPITQVNQDAVQVTGTAEAGSTVFVAFEDSAAGETSVSTTASSIDGTYTVTADLTDLADGDITVTASAQDAVGNEGPDSAPVVVEKDTSGPDVLTVMVMDGGDEFVNASEAAAGVSVDGTVSSTATSVEVELTDGLTVITSTAGLGVCVLTVATDCFTADFDVTQMASLVDGPITATAVGTDVDGNEGAPLSDTSTLDTEAPDAPSSITFDPDMLRLGVTTSTITATAEALATIDLTVDDANAGNPDETVTGTAIAGSGEPSVTFADLDLSGLDDGTLTATLIATDPAGNTSAPGTGTASKDVLLPAAPTIDWDENAEDGIVDATEVDSTGLSGATEDGATVTVTIVDRLGQTLLPKPVSDPAVGGTWTITVNASALADGTLTATAKATDAAGNPSASSSAPATVTKDANAETVEAYFDDGDGFVNDAESSSLQIIGTAEALSTIEVDVTDGFSVVTGTATANAGGTWATDPDLDVSGLLDGVLTVTAVATDGVGNTATSAPDTSTLDTDVAAPTIVIVDGDGFLNATEADDFSFTATGEALGTLDFTLTGTSTYDLSGSLGLGSEGATSAAFGGFASSFGEGTLTLTAFVTDLAGNVSSTTIDTSTIDTIAPTIADVVIIPNPVGEGAAADIEITGTSTEDSSLVITLSDIAEETADLTVTGTAIGPDLGATGTGTAVWSVDGVTVADLADGTVTATVVATDAAGNVSDAASGTALLDRVEPDAPTIVFITDPVNIASGTNILVTGTATPADVDFVTVSVSDGTLATAPVDVTVTDGAWSVNIEVGSLADGTLTVTASATDEAGNTSPGSDTSTTTKDMVAPTGTTVVILDGDGSIDGTEQASFLVTGTAEALTTVVLVLSDADEAVTYTGIAVDEGGDWSQTVSATSLDDGTLTATAVATDAAGNSSAAAVDTTTMDTTGPTYVSVSQDAPGSPIVTLTGSETLSAIDGTLTASAFTVTAMCTDEFDAEAPCTVGTVTITDTEIEVNLNGGIVTTAGTITLLAGNVEDALGNMNTAWDAAPVTALVVPPPPV